MDGANETLSCGFPSIPGIAPGVAPRIVVFVLLKSSAAIPRMGFKALPSQMGISATIIGDSTLRILMQKKTCCFDNLHLCCKIQHVIQKTVNLINFIFVAQCNKIMQALHSVPETRSVKQQVWNQNSCLRGRHFWRNTFRNMTCIWYRTSPLHG